MGAGDRKENMRTAVLMSSYNGQKYIRQQIDSILAQEGDFQLELWVRDDGSTDGTKEILQEYADRGQLNWYCGANMGPARSFLDLLGHCRGYDYYAFADQDDVWMKEKVQTGLNSLADRTGPALYFSNAELVDAELQSLGREVYKKSPRLDFYTLLCAGGLLGCTMVFNRGLAELLCRGDIPNNVVMHDFYAAIVCAALNGTIYFDMESHMKYRQHGDNVVGVSSGMGNAIKNRIEHITDRQKIGIAEQAEELVNRYGMDMPENFRRWAGQVAGYRKSFAGRLCLACSPKTQYVNRHTALTLRMAILMGSR